MSKEQGYATPDFKITHDVLNEQTILAAAIVDPKVRAELASRVRAEHFQDTDHALAWASILRATAQGHDPSPTAIVQLSGGKLDKKYLEDVVAANPKVPRDIRFHIDALQWDMTRAKAVQGPLSELLRALQDPGMSQERVRALAKQIPISFQGSSSRTHLRDGAKLVADHRAVLRQRMNGIGLYPTGIEGLDRYPPNSLDDNGNDVSGQPLLVPGLEPGKITTVTAISGGGKSTIVAKLALNQARMCAERECGKVLYGAWEMSPADVLELMACISTGISRNRVKTGQITDAEWKLLCNTMDAIAQWVKFVDMPFHKERGVRHTHDEVLDVIHGYIADSGASIAIFDLWRRAFRRMKDESDEQEALYRQQAIAEETNCHCLLVQQQRLKDIETRQNPMPTREGVKGSSAWVDVSDTMIGVYLPGLMKRVSRNVIQLLVLKQRYGRWPLTIEYQWDGDIVHLHSGQLVWDVAIGDESKVQSGPSGHNGKKKKDLSKAVNVVPASKLQKGKGSKAK
ncbi:MAG: DnaB-like helicase C-terminal domain-containing protein [Parcubacteria group bacterium]